MVPDVSLADLAGKSFYVPAQFIPQGDLGRGERRQGAGVTFSGHFEHCKISPQAEYCKGCCQDSESDDCSPGYNFYSKGPFWF